MGIKDNRDMVFSNIAQQLVSTLLFLFIPGILGVENYAQVTYVATLLAFISFADFGLSFVYGRKMPAVYGRNDVAEISLWNSTTFRFRFYTAFIFSGVICLIYLAKYGDIINAALLFLIPPASVVPLFFIANNISQQKFSVTRNLNILQSLTRLVVLPTAAVASLRGWFAGQLIAALVILGKRDLRVACRQLWIPKTEINWRLIYDHLPEAVSLGLITTLWLQLLYSGRVFAAFMYPDAVIAQYGVAGTAYQVVASLVIAAFVPQTIKAYKMLEEDQGKAVIYIFEVIIKALPIMAVMVLIGVFIAPSFFEYFFPAYQIKPLLVTPLIVSLISYPVIVSLGALLIGTKRSNSYLALIACWLIIDWVLAKQIAPYFGYNSAAVAQLISLSLYAISILVFVLILFSRHLKKRWHAYLSGAVSLSSAIICLLLLY